MSVITINGPIGGGGRELGVLVAELLGADYVDRLVLTEAAKRIGSTVDALADKEERVVRFKDRLAFFLQNVLEKSAISGAAGEPYYTSGMETLPAEQYTELARETITEAQQLSDKRFIEVTSAVIQEIANAGNVVIIGRAANMILKDLPGALHVYLSASPEKCIETIIQREGFSRQEAERYVAETDKARMAFFRKFFKVQVDDPTLYHLSLNMDRLKLETAAEIVVHAAKDLEA